LPQVVVGLIVPGFKQALAKCINRSATG
jgi:hypothetical protein